MFYVHLGPLFARGLRVAAAACSYATGEVYLCYTVAVGTSINLCISSGCKIKLEGSIPNCPFLL